VRGFARVYQKSDGDVLPVKVTVFVTDARGEIKLSKRSDLAAGDFLDAGADVSLAIPPGSLEAGEYLLTVAAATTAHAVRRDLRFSINAAGIEALR
jgi:hypothetical protein